MNMITSITASNNRNNSISKEYHPFHNQNFTTVIYYSHAPHNDILVNDSIYDDGAKRL